MSFLLDWLALFEPKWLCDKDVVLFEQYRNKLQLNQFLMAFSDDFEHVQTSLLHCKTFPTLDDALIEILSKERWKSSLHVPKSLIVPSKIVLATIAALKTPSSHTKNFDNSSNNRN